jgi:hypothetical protein
VSTNLKSHLRVRVGIALRDARKRCDFNQTEGAEAAGHKQAWLNKIESGDIGLKPGKLELLIAKYVIDDRVADELRRMNHADNTGGTYIESGANPDWWQELQEIELQARVLKAVHLQAHDGLIQSEPYMRRQFELNGKVDVEVAVKARLDRQRRILDRPDAPEVTVVLEEACLHTDMGDPAMMAAQLEHLLGLFERPTVTVLVKPFNALFPVSTYGFTMVHFDSAVMRDFVSIEYAVGAATIEDETDVRTFQQRWEMIRSAALSPYATRDLLRSKLAAYRRPPEEPQDP